jgi:hypothetical protein
VDSQMNAKGLARLIVYLTLQSDVLTIERMSESLGIPPDTTKKRGQLNSAGKPFDKNSWTVKAESYVPENADDFVVGMNACLRQLLSRITEHGEAFRRLAASEEATLLIGITAKRVPPIVIDGDILETMCSLKVRQFEVDIII